MLPDCKIGSSTHDPSRVTQGRAGQSHAVVSKYRCSKSKLLQKYTGEKKKVLNCLRVTDFSADLRRGHSLCTPSLPTQTLELSTPKLAYIFHKLYLQGLLCTLTYL